MLDMHLVSIWKAQKAQGTYVNYHTHKYHELVYYLYGNGETTVDEQRYNFADNCFAVIPPLVCHDELHSSDSELICLEFSGASDLSKGVYADTLGTVHRILRDLLYEAKNQHFGFKDMITAKLNELYLHLMRNENNVSDEKNFEYIINYIKENYHEKIILSDCAKQLNISYDYFQHKFKRLTGYSPQQFLIRQRLSASEAMLKAGNLSCTEIAYRCGFSTSAQYSALFKKEYGMPPLQFQKNKIISLN